MEDEKTDDIITSVEDESLFSLVKELDKFNKILKNHIANEGQVLLRNANGDQFFSKIFTINLSNSIECAPPVSRSGDCLPSFINKNILVDIFSGEERFHFQTITNIIPKHPQLPTLLLPIPGQIFQRQRRTEFRYILPDNFQADFKLKNNANQFFTGRLLDISNMGVSVLWRNNFPKFKNNELIEGILRLGSESGFPIKGLICFLKSATDSLRIGMEFTEVDTNTLMALSSRIVSLRNFVFESKKH